jgi:hypothetical protein
MDITKVNPLLIKPSQVSKVGPGEGEQQEALHICGRTGRAPDFLAGAGASARPARRSRSASFDRRPAPRDRGGCGERPRSVVSAQGQYLLAAARQLAPLSPRCRAVERLLSWLMVASWFLPLASPGFEESVLPDLSMCSQFSPARSQYALNALFMYASPIIGSV